MGKNSKLVPSKFHSLKGSAKGHTPWSDTRTVSQRVDDAIWLCLERTSSELKYDPSYRLPVGESYYAESMLHNMCGLGPKPAQRLKGGRINVHPKDKGHDTYSREVKIEVKVIDQKTGELYHPINATQLKEADIFAIYNPSHQLSFSYKGKNVPPQTYLLIMK